MIPAILIGRGGSVGLPKKCNASFGKTANGVPFLAAKNCKLIDKIYVSTDASEIKKVAKDLNAEIIDRPKNLPQAKPLWRKFSFTHIMKLKKTLKKK